MKRNVTCPSTGLPETVEYAVDPETARVLGPTRCTQFDPSDAVGCTGDCLVPLNRGFRPLQVHHWQGRAPYDPERG